MAKQNLLQTLLDGPLAISGTTVDVTNDIVWGEIINITNADAVLTNRKKTVFELVKVNIVNNVVTFIKRGLTKSETETEDVSLKKSWKKGDYLYITVLAPSFISIDNSQQRQSPQDFSGYTNTFGNTIHNGYAKFQGTTNPGVVFNEFTTAEREALSPIGPAIVYDTTVGEWYKYVNGAWTQISTGGTFPRASETVEGKVRVQTDVEFLAGSDTGGDGATLVTKPSKIVEQINTEISNIESVLTNSDFMTGEALVEGDSIFGEEPITFADADKSQLIGDVAGNTRVSARAIGSGVAGNTLKLSLAKVVSPSVDLGIRIETDNAGSPSGTLVNANATATVAPGDLTTDLADTTITLAGSITIAKGTVVHIVIFQGTYGSETVNATNHYKIGFDVKNTTTRYYQTFNGTNWITSDGIELLDADGITKSSTGAFIGDADTGQRIQARKNIIIRSVTKNVNANPTKCYIKNDAGTILATADFVGNVATFGYSVIINKDDYFRVEADKDGASYTYYRNTSPGYPKTLTNIIYNTGSLDGANDASAWNIDSITTIEAGGLPYPIYTSSDLFATTLYSKTDARYTYKLPDIPRIVDKAYSAGEIPKRDFKGISKHLTGLTKGTELFVSDTPGALSTTPGTIKTKIGNAIDTDEIYIDKRFIDDTERDIETELRFFGATISSTEQIFGMDRTGISFTMSGKSNGAGSHEFLTASTFQAGKVILPKKIGAVTAGNPALFRQDVIMLEFEANIAFGSGDEWRIGFGTNDDASYHTEATSNTRKVLIQHKGTDAFVTINTSDGTTQSLSSNLAVSNYTLYNNYRLKIYPGVKVELYINGVLAGTKTTNIPSGTTDILNWGLGTNISGDRIFVCNPKVRIKYS